MFHACLLDSTVHVYLVLRPSLTMVLAGWWGRGPDRQTQKWRDSCCGTSEGRQLSLAQLGSQNHPGLPEELPRLAIDQKDGGSHQVNTGGWLVGW